MRRDTPGQVLSIDTVGSDGDNSDVARGPYTFWLQSSGCLIPTYYCEKWGDSCISFTIHSLFLSVVLTVFFSSLHLSPIAPQKQYCTSAPAPLGITWRLTPSTLERRHNSLRSPPLQDTFVVGCAYEPSIIYPDTFVNNPDYYDPVYSTKYGIYKPNCGLDNVMLSWGHDEYLYNVLKDQSSLPEEGLAMIRYHSFYP